MVHRPCTASRLPRGWSCWTRSTIFKRTRRPIWRCAGIRRPASAARARRRSMARPRLTCKTCMDALPLDKPITVQPMKGVSRDQRSGYRRFLELPRQQENSAIRAPLRHRLENVLGNVDQMQDVGSVLNASCARMCATSSVSTRRWSSSEDHGFSSGWRGSRCILSTPSSALECSRMNSASVCATSRSAARKCAPRRFTSRIMRSPRHVSPRLL